MMNPSYLDVQLDELLPVKAAVTMTKLSNRTSVYSLAGSGNPLFFELDHGGIYPTVYTLWRYPSLVPVQIATYSEVTPKVRARTVPCAKSHVPCVASSAHRALDLAPML